MYNNFQNISFWTETNAGLLVQFKVYRWVVMYYNTFDSGRFDTAKPDHSAEKNILFSEWKEIVNFVYQFGCYINERLHYRKNRYKFIAVSTKF